MPQQNGSDSLIFQQIFILSMHIKANIILKFYYHYHYSKIVRFDEIDKYNWGALKFHFYSWIK